MRDRHVLRGSERMWLADKQREMLRSIASSLRQKTVLVTGASRGIGRAIALRCARDGANVVLLARSQAAPSHRGLDGTVSQVAREVEDAGGVALPIGVDLRDDRAIKAAVTRTIARFGAIDAVVNNASAMHLGKSPRSETFDLMMQVNARGTAHAILAARPHLERTPLRHVLTISPPLGSVVAVEPGVRDEQVCHDNAHPRLCRCAARQHVVAKEAHRHRRDARARTPRRNSLL